MWLGDSRLSLRESFFVLSRSERRLFESVAPKAQQVTDCDIDANQIRQYAGLGNCEWQLPQNVGRLEYWRSSPSVIHDQLLLLGPSRGFGSWNW
jgi:hypothetical protein